MRRLGFPPPWVESETEEIRQLRHDGFRRFRAPGASPEEVRKALGGTRVEFLSLGHDWSVVGRSLKELDLRGAGGAIILAVVSPFHPCSKAVRTSCPASSRAS